MKEHGILYKPEMVRAYLAGRKTQTRRLAIDKSGRPSKWTKANAGDVLWGREAWARTSVFPGVELVVYREGDNRTDYGGPWRPGIHMFRCDSRITQPLLEVRIQRLQDITEEDAWAEGCAPGTLDDYGRPFPAEEPLPGGGVRGWDDAREWYADLWDEINGEGSWDENPEVVAMSYPRFQAPASGGGDA